MKSAIILFGEVFSSDETFGHAFALDAGIEYFAVCFHSRQAVIEAIEQTDDIAFGRINFRHEFELFDAATSEARKVYYL